MTAKKRIHPPAHSFSKIKDIWLEVANPGFVHRHLGEEKADFFLGRKKAKERLKTLLTRSQSPSGAYLVTGFRGMGKTSLVHEVIREIAPIKHYKTASISLSQDDIRDLDVLRLIARQLHQIWRQNHLYFNLWRSSLWILLGFALLIGMWLSPLTIDCFPLYLLDKPFCDWPKYSTGIFLTASGVLTFALLLIRMAPFLFRPQQTYRNISKRLSFLNSRLDATVTLEMSNSMSSRTGATEINQGSKNTRNFPVATAKDIEKELIDILNDIHQYRQHINFFKSLKEVPEFVFILDELDKIEPEFIVAPAQSSADSHLMLFRVSGLFYLKANRSFSCAFQFKKFLFTIKDWLAFFGRAWLINEPAKLTERGRLLTRLETLLVSDEPRPGIASRLLRSIVWSADVANRPQLMKYREILNLERQQDTFSIYNNISTSAEMREVVLLIEDIRLKIRSLADIAENMNGAINEFQTLESLSLNLVSPYDSIYSKYVRIMELRFKCEYNFALVKSIGFPAKTGEKSGAFCAVELLQRNDFKKNDSDYLAGKLAKLSDKQQESLEARVLDSIFCLYEVIRSLNIYGINYITNHSFLANAHYKLANWCRAYYNLRMIRISKAGPDELEKRKAGQEMDQKLIQLLGTDALYALEPNYHCEQALEHYYAAMQTHKGGRSYRDNVTNLSFLEDDLNDNLTHFSAATERFRINTGVIRDKIKSLKREIKNSQVYDYWSYVEV